MLTHDDEKVDTPPLYFKSILIIPNNILIVFQ